MPLFMVIRCCLYNRPMAFFKSFLLHDIIAFISSGEDLSPNEVEPPFIDIKQ